MNKKRALVNLYKDIVLVTRVPIVYQQQHKSRDSNRCLSGASTACSNLLHSLDMSL
jgi:hypothetical protein